MIDAIRHLRTGRRAAVLIVLAAGLAGCAGPRKTEPAQAPAVSRYARPLPPGSPALRLAGEWPDLGAVYRGRDAMLLDALDHSAGWFTRPSSRTHFPLQGITHEQAEASVLAMRELLTESGSEAAFIADMQRVFDVYESVGYDGSGVVLYTGYYAPIFHASTTRTSRFNVPLYRRPDDLVTDPKDGRPLGRSRADGTVEPWPTRAEIESSRLFEGNELVWLENDLDAYIVHVNGSARLRLTDGRNLYIGYAGKTDRPYGSLGQAMEEAGLLGPDQKSLAAIRRAYRAQPDAVRRCMLRNESYVFFTEYPPERWPAGSLGVPVTPERSLATDKSIYPRGGVVLVETDAITYTGGTRRFHQLMLDQDTGGAINAPGRADIFMGIGPAAEILAGGQYAEGRLWYFFVKPEYVSVYRR